MPPENQETPQQEPAIPVSPGEVKDEKEKKYQNDYDILLLPDNKKSLDELSEDLRKNIATKPLGTPITISPGEHLLGCFAQYIYGEEISQENTIPIANQISKILENELNKEGWNYNTLYDKVLTLSKGSDGTLTIDFRRYTAPKNMKDPLENVHNSYISGITYDPVTRSIIGKENIQYKTSINKDTNSENTIISDEDISNIFSNFLKENPGIQQSNPNINEKSLNLQLKGQNILLINGKPDIEYDNHNNSIILIGTYHRTTTALDGQIELSTSRTDIKKEETINIPIIIPLSSLETMKPGSTRYYKETEETFYDNLLNHYQWDAGKNTSATKEIQATLKDLNAEFIDGESYATTYNSTDNQLIITGTFLVQDQPQNDNNSYDRSNPTAKTRKQKKYVIFP